MPQPYLPNFKHKKYAISMHSIYRRPQFEAAIGRSIALWSHVDSQVGQLFALLIGVESEATHRVYLLLRRWSNQRQSLEEAARGSLSGDPHNVFLALMAEYSILERQRNDLSHGVFGACPDDETFLFMIKIEDHVLWRTDNLEKVEDGAFKPVNRDDLEKCLWVYRLSDFERMHEQMGRLLQGMSHFNAYLTNPKYAGPNALFHRLLSSAHIQRHISLLKQTTNQNDS